MLFTCRCTRDESKPWMKDVFGAQDVPDVFTTNHRDKRYRVVAVSGTVEMHCRRCGATERVLLEAVSGTAVVSS